MQTIFEKCPFKGNGKLSKLFRLVPWGLNLPAGSDTPQNKILGSIRPCRTRSCGVSDTTELSLAGYQTLQNNGRVVYILPLRLVLRSLIPRRTTSCGVWYPAEQNPAGFETPQNNIWIWIFLQIGNRIKNILQCEFGDWVDSWKKPEVKISCYCPFKSFWHILAGCTIFHVGLKYTEVWSSLAHEERPTQRIVRDLVRKEIMSFFVEGHQIIKNNSYRTAKVISLSPAFVRLLSRTDFFSRWHVTFPPRLS